MTDQAYVHPSADVDPTVTIGIGTKVWHLVQIRGGVTIGDNCILGKEVYIDEDIRVGNNVKIQNRVSIFKDCIVEDGVFIGPHVCITNDLRPRAINPDGTLKSADDWSAGSTHIAYGAAIGAGSIILPSRRIGRFAMIGAGSVVTRDVPDHVLVVGNPARPIGYVCACGERLNQSSDASERFACQRCDAEYELSEDQSVRKL